MDCEAPTLPKQKHGSMPTTSPWLVDMAKQGEAALGELCVLYWQPIHVFIRYWLARYGRSPQDAGDLTQEFMKQLLTRGVGSYQPEHDGRPRRFRFWLLGAVKHFLSKSFKGQQREKNDERLTHSWEALAPQERALFEPRTAMTPERMFTFTFASCVGEQAWQTTREWYAARGDAEVFDRLERFIPGDELADFDYGAAAVELGRSRVWVRKKVELLRLRYQQNLRGQVRLVVPRESDVDDEWTLLFGTGPGEQGDDCV